MDMRADNGARARARGLAVFAAILTSLLACAGVRADPEMLFEPATGTVLLAVEPDRPWHPASITKMMTAYIVFEDIKARRITTDADVPLSPYARIQPATRIGLRAGIKINIEQAVAGMLLRSANDFAVAIAERISGDEGSFAQRMNATARRLGMTRTRFKNPHGLPHDEQVTTARDMALLTMALLKDFPEQSKVFAAPTVHIHKGTFHNGNDLLRSFEGADGLKTGFTCASGYNVVATATRDGRRLAAIVFGAGNRNERSKRAAALLEAGFTFLQEQALIKATARPATAIANAATAPGASPGEPNKALAVPSTAVAVAVAGPSSATEDEGDSDAPPRLRAIALKDLALSPAEVQPPHDATIDTRMRKCPGSGRARHRRSPQVAKGGDPGGKKTSKVMTGSVAGKRRMESAPPSPASGEGDKTD